MLTKKDHGFKYQVEMENEKSIQKFIPYNVQISDEIISLGSGEFVSVVELKGIVSTSTTDEEINKLSNKLNLAMLSIADQRITIYHTAVKKKISITATETIPHNEFSKEFHDAYSESLKKKNHFEVCHYFSFVLKNVLTNTSGLIEMLGGLFSGKKDTSLSTLSKHRFDELNHTIEKFMNVMNDYGPRRLGVVRKNEKYISEPLSLFYFLLNGHEREIPLNEKIINQYLATTRPIFKKGFGVLVHAHEPARYFSTLSIKERLAKDTGPKDINELMNIPYEYVFTNTFEFAATRNAIEEVERKQRGLTNANSKGFREIDDLSFALDELTSRDHCMGYSTMDITVYGNSEEEMKRGIKAADQALANAQFVPVRDDIVLEAKKWAQLPANNRFRTRVARISSKNFASWSSMHVDYKFDKGRRHRWGETLLVARTRNQSPVYLNFHTGDGDQSSGETLITGKKGSGKTILMIAALISLAKYPATTIYFDKEYGARPAFESLGGNYSVIKTGIPTGFNPCKLKDTPQNRSYLRALLESMLDSRNEPLTSQQQTTIDSLVEANFIMPFEHRRLRNLKHNFANSQELVGRFNRWINDGAFSWVFDNEDDLVDLSNPYTGFDLTEILNDDDVRSQTIGYLTHRVNQLIDGRKIAIFFDEGWKAIEDEFLSETLKNWQLTIRKQNGIIIFGTQHVRSLLSGKKSDEEICTGEIIAKESVTQLFGYNPEVKYKDYSVLFNISEHEFELIKSLNPREFLYRQPENGISEIITLDLNDMTDILECMGGNTAKNAIIENLKSESGEFKRSEYLRMIRNDIN